MRRPSLVTRVLRSLTALVTVWCLGCSAFDPLIASLFPGDGPMMVCASEGPRSVQPGATNESSVSAPAPDRGASDGTSCGCASCTAPAPTGFAVAAPAQALPQQPATDAISPSSVARTPLVPPPQHAA
jgi:hypothetical protein